MTGILEPVAGKIKVVATPVKFRQNPASVRIPAPELGQHTEEILLELGYSWEDIAQFKEQGGHSIDGDCYWCGDNFGAGSSVTKRC